MYISASITPGGAKPTPKGALSHLGKPNPQGRYLIWGSQTLTYVQGRYLIWGRQTLTYRGATSYGEVKQNSHFKECYIAWRSQTYTHWGAISPRGIKPTLTGAQSYLRKQSPLLQGRYLTFSAKPFLTGGYN